MSVQLGCSSGCDEFGGECQECDGNGFTECLCTTCMDLHKNDCDHCDGTGVCATGAAQDQPTAAADWREFKEMQSFPLTVEAFRENWQRMFGQPAPREAVLQFFEKAEKMARRARAKLPSPNWRESLL